MPNGKEYRFLCCQKFLAHKHRSENFWNQKKCTAKPQGKYAGRGHKYPAWSNLAMLCSLPFVHDCEKYIMLSEKKTNPNTSRNSQHSIFRCWLGRFEKSDGGKQQSNTRCQEENWDQTLWKKKLWTIAHSERRPWPGGLVQGQLQADMLLGLGASRQEEKQGK